MKAPAGFARFYAEHVGGDGRLLVQRYLEAAVRHRDALLGGTVTAEEVATKEKLNPKYFGTLWHVLAAETGPAETGAPLDAIRNHWRTATGMDVPALANEVAEWQAALWKTTRVGSYVRQDDSGTYVLNSARQIAVDPRPVESVPLRLTVKPAPGQTEIVLFLAFREMVPTGSGSVADPGRGPHVPERGAGEALRHPWCQRAAVATG